MWKKHRVHKMMEKNFWDGFFERLGNGIGPSRCMTYYECPAWWNDVSDVAFAAGWTYADEVVANLGTRRFGFAIDRKIPPRVVADCYAAARIT